MRFGVGLLLLLLSSVSVWASSDKSLYSSGMMEEVMVVGVQPGPRLWKVSKDDHELWILGTVSPLPKKLQWDSIRVETVLADSQEFIWPPYVGIKASTAKTLFMLPSLIGVKKNPDGAKLEEILDPELYQRWLVLKERHIGRSRGIEKHRPMFAASELFDKALGDYDLASYRDSNDMVFDVIRRSVKKHKIENTGTEIVRKVDSPGKMIKQFKKSSIDDVVCFTKTIERLENDMGVMRTRAMAWATGNIPKLRALPFEDQDQACSDAFFDSSVAKDHDLEDVPQRMKAKWLEAVENALTNNQVSFAMLSMSELLNPDGYLSDLSRKGYRVEAPGS